MLIPQVSRQGTKKLRGLRRRYKSFENSRPKHLDSPVNEFSLSQRYDTREVEVTLITCISIALQGGTETLRVRRSLRLLPFFSSMRRIYSKQRLWQYPQ